MFDQICQQIVSPPRFRYSNYDLGPLMSKYGKRKDFSVKNKQQNQMYCSYYEPFSVQYQRVCVIYLHSMNGSRLQGSVYADKILRMGVCFCTFDFSGCGNSEGSKISFGCNEKYDVEEVVKKLKSEFFVNRFVFWGRSMGSVCAIKYCEYMHQKHQLSTQYRDQILGLILDSAFKSFSKLIVQVGNKRSDVPQFLIKAGFFLIRRSLEEKGSFKVKDLQIANDAQNSSKSGLNSQKILAPIERISRAFQNSHYEKSQLPILFLASKQDKTVSCQHSIDIFDAYQSDVKLFKYFKGEHNECRNEQCIEDGTRFIKNILGGSIREYVKEESQKLQNATAFQKEMLSFCEVEKQQTNCSCSMFNSQRQTLRTSSSVSNLPSTGRQLSSSQKLHHFPSYKNLPSVNQIVPAEDFCSNFQQRGSPNGWVAPEKGLNKDTAINSLNYNQRQTQSSNNNLASELYQPLNMNGEEVKGRNSPKLKTEAYSRIFSLESQSRKAAESRIRIKTQQSPKT